MQYGLLLCPLNSNICKAPILGMFVQPVPDYWVLSGQHPDITREGKSCQTLLPGIDSLTLSTVFEVSHYKPSEVPMCYALSVLEQPEELQHL